MIETKIPGIQAKHIMITETCRKNRSVSGAFQEAIRLLEIEYNRLNTFSANKEAIFHLVMTVDRSK